MYVEVPTISQVIHQRTKYRDKIVFFLFNQTKDSADKQSFELLKSVLYVYRYGKINSENRIYKSKRLSDILLCKYEYFLHSFKLMRQLYWSLAL